MHPARPTQRSTRPRSGPRTLALGLAAALGILLRAPPAAALPPTIEWRAPAGCPDEAQVQAHILRVVGPGALAAADTLTHVQASASPRGDTWLLAVVFTASDATTTQRQLNVRDCQSAADATALLVAIAVARTAPVTPSTRELPPVLALESPHHESTDFPPTKDPAPKPTTIHRPAAPPNARRQRPRLVLALGPALALGILPRVTPGLHLALGPTWPRLRLTVAYTRWFRSPARLAARPELGTDLSLHLASARVGPVRRVGPLELQAQLGLEFGALRAQGIGSALTFDRQTWWGATLVGSALAWTPRALRGRGALLLQAELVLALHRPTFTLGPDLPIFRLGPAGLRAALLLEARLF